MSVINFWSFDILPLLGNKGKTKLAQSQNMCTMPMHTFLQKIT